MHLVKIRHSWLQRSNSLCVCLQAFQLCRSCASHVQPLLRTVPHVTMKHPASPPLTPSQRVCQFTSVKSPASMPHRSICIPSSGAKAPHLTKSPTHTVQCGPQQPKSYAHAAVEHHKKVWATQRGLDGADVVHCLVLLSACTCARTCAQTTEALRPSKTFRGQQSRHRPRILGRQTKRAPTQLAIARQPAVV